MTAKKKTEKGKDDFKSVSKRLGCAEDKAAFEERLGKLAKRDKHRSTKAPH